MPEGDSIAKAGARLGPALTGKEVVSVYGTAPQVRAHSNRLSGTRVAGVRTFGKHLVIDFEEGLSIRVHLGMPGRWTIIPSHRRVPGSARLCLTTDEHHVCCFAAPTVEVARTPAIDQMMARLGPDFLDPAFDPAVFVDRARTRAAQPVGTVLLDQRVAAGIGNVYKSEVLFLAGVHPETPVEAIDDARMLEIAGLAHRLLQLNVRAGPRITTGERAVGREVWVYDRAGQPCRKCSTAVEMSRLGDRVTYWCPSCQPLAVNR